MNKNKKYNYINQKPLTEELYKEELEALKKIDNNSKPKNWVLSPQAVRDFILGKELENITIKRKFYGDGIAIFDNEEDLKILKKELINCSDEEYWEYCILRAIDKINFYSFNYDDIYTEIDSFKDALYHNLLTPEEIAQQCSDDGKIERLAGITNINYKIKFLNEYKVIRIPGKGTENIIDRTSEKEILNILYDKDIVPKSDFYDSDIKLTDYLEGYRSLDFDDLKNYETIFPLIIKQMKKLHSMPHDNYKNFNVISMIEEIKKYEKLANITLVTKIEHKFLLNIARKMDEGKQVLCHRDLQLPNIMYNGKEIKF